MWNGDGEQAAARNVTTSDPGDQVAPDEQDPDDELVVLRGDAELAAMFIGEALDHLSSIETCILRLETMPGDAGLLNDIFRPFHTIKGNAGALGVIRIQELAHKVENLLDLCRAGRHTLGPDESQAVLEAVDVLTALIVDAQERLAGQPARDLEPKRRWLMSVVDGVVAGRPFRPFVDRGPRDARGRDTDDDAVGRTLVRRADDSIGVVKIDTRKLDSLVDMVGELVIAQTILEADPALAGSTDERLTRHVAQLKRITSGLQRTALSMRMVPIRQTFQKMSRLVRDLSKTSGKPVDLVLAGEDTELDRRVVEEMHDPLMHMIRNSMDHGFETPERRAGAGKRPVGRLALSAYHQGGSIMITIQDDGAGLDTERILAKARNQGLVREGDVLPPSEVHQLIFHPGFTTAEQVTEISGRGVGMDVVRRNIEALRGRIEIQTTSGQGTSFLIKLPVTLAILDGLVLGVGAERFVMPTFAIRESLRPTPEQIHRVAGAPRLLQVREHLVPLVWLSELHGIAGGQVDPCAATVVVLEDEGHQVGVVVDGLLGKQEVVIKSLGDALGQVGGVAGAAILGDGRVGLILDAHGIVQTLGDTARAA